MIYVNKVGKSLNLGVVLESLTFKEINYYPH